jgi:hypothetical protein
MQLYCIVYARKEKSAMVSKDCSMSNRSAMDDVAIYLFHVVSFFLKNEGAKESLNIIPPVFLISVER